MPMKRAQRITAMKSKWAWRSGAVAAAVAAFPVMAGGWGPSVTITGYYIWDSGFAALTTSSNQNPDSCSSSHYLILDTNQVNFKAIWAQVIAAQAQGQTVQLSYSGCSGPYPLINAIAVPGIW
jgi:hypothetical protein